MENRRITRARSASEELAQPSKMKQSSKAKKGGLPIIQESPSKRSSGGLSGTTAQNSILVAKGMEDATEKLVDGLGDLWEISEQFLNKILVEPFTRDTVLQLAARLKTSPRFQKDIINQHTKLKDVMGQYPGSPINVVSSNLHIFSLRNTNEFSEGFHRPDNILYRANLAYAIGIFVEKIIENLEDFDADDMLRLFFATFSRVLKSNEEVVSGSTSKLKATFELALDLQVCAFFQMLEDALEEGQEDFDALGILDESFYKNNVLRGWEIPGLQYKDLTKNQRNTITERVKKIHSRLDKSQSWRDLKDEVSDIALIYRCFSWARERNIELTQQMEKVPDGLLGTQEAIDAEISRVKTPQKSNAARTKKPRTEPAFYHPDELPKVGASVRARAPISKRTPNRASRQQSSEEDSAVTALAYQDAASIDGNDDFEPAQFVGDEGGAEDEHAMNKETERYDPTAEETVQLSQHLAARSRQANKENFPHKGSQELHHSQKRTDFSSFNDRNVRLSKGKGKRLYEDGEPDEDIGNITDLSQDGDNVFVTQQTPERSNRQRRRMDLVPAGTGSPRIPIRNSTVRETTDRSGMGSPDTFSRTQRTERYNIVNQEAKLRVAEMKPKAPPRARIPWSAEETECLLEYIEQYATGWAKIKQQDELHENILECRDQVALKDKARNMKLDFLKANKPLPPNFEDVALKKADIEKLRDMGHYNIHGRDEGRE